MDVRRIMFVSITVAIISIFAFLYVNEYGKLLRIRSKTAWVELTVNVLRKRNFELSERLKWAKTKFYVEKVARESLGMSMPGEKIYYIIMKKNK